MLIDKPGVSHDIFTFLRNLNVHIVFARGKFHPKAGREGPQGSIYIALLFV
jgi:hypothetical protein